LLLGCDTNNVPSSPWFNERSELLYPNAHVSRQQVVEIWEHLDKKDKELEKRLKDLENVKKNSK